MRGAESLGPLSNDLRCNICNRIQRENVFIGGFCKCGCSAFWQSSLTFYERLMFTFGFWTRSDFTDVMAIKATLGGELYSHKASIEKLIEKES